MSAVATRAQWTQRLILWRDKLRARWRALAPR